MSKPTDDEVNMSLRNSDPAAPIIKVTREIPLPWLISLVGSGFLIGATVFFTQIRQGEKLDSVITDVKTVLKSQDDTKEKVRDQQYELRELRTRVTALESSKGTPP